MNFIENAHAKTVSECIIETKSNDKGLEVEFANDRLIENGKNALPHVKGKSFLYKFFLQFKNMMIFILLVCAGISFLVSEVIDGIIILIIVVINAVIGFVQENNAEKALLSLKKMSEPYVKVLRGGKPLKIKSEDIVVGDIILLEAGDKVSADLRIIESAMLKIDEASLTGESEAVIKNCDLILNEKTPLADRVNMAYSGSLVAYGRGVGLVVATGEKTEIGRIAKMISEDKEDETPLQKSLKTVGKVITIIVLFLAVVIFLLEIFRAQNISITDAFLTSIAIAVAAIPESLPAVVTIIMAIGVSNLAKEKAIVKKLHAIETLGACEIICSDKTGTITKNVMTVKKVSYNTNTFSDIECDKDSIEFQTLIKIIALCNDSKKSENKYVGDPTETALSDFALGYGFDKLTMESPYKRIYELPFDSKRKLMSTVNVFEKESFLFCKGGIDEILAKCSYIFDKGNKRKLTKKDIKKILSINQNMTDDSLRVLGCAFKEVNNKRFYTERNLTFVGMVGMIDPPRDEVFDAVAKCKKAGIRPVMITGDHSHTALAIARQVGIASKESEVLTGTDIDSLTDEQFLNKIKHINVFARVSPENKVRIVEGFKKLGKIVAMTGDGVNDAPSLKKANIGVGMGITGTDVTKEVADIIITDDSFATIIVAVSEGRKIYKNIQKTINFLFATNFCEVFSLLIASIVFPSLTFLLPIQIIFINLFTDSLPAIALGRESVEKGIMEKPPRKAGQNMFQGGVGISIVVQGMIQTLLVLSAFIIGNQIGGNSVATSMGFFTLNLIQIFFIMSARFSNSIFKNNPFKNKWMIAAICSSLLFLTLTAFTPLGYVLGLVSLSFNSWLIVIGLAFLIIPFNEIYKLILKRILSKKNKM